MLKEENIQFKQWDIRIALLLASARYFSSQIY